MNFEQALQIAIQANPTLVHELAKTQEDHNERAANSPLNSPYFHKGEKVGLKNDWSLGEIVEIKASDESFKYLIKWLNFANQPTGIETWHSQNEITL